jgi:hypothetical protein
MDRGGRRPARDRRIACKNSKIRVAGFPLAARADVGARRIGIEFPTATHRA